MRLGLGLGAGGTVALGRKCLHQLGVAGDVYKRQEWYQARIVEGKAPGRWTCKRDLYDWWLGEVETKATDHRCV